MTFVLVVALGFGVLLMQSAIENVPIIATLTSILSGGPSSDVKSTPVTEKPGTGSSEAKA